MAQIIMTVEEFVNKWKKVDLTERSAAQSHFIDLCHLLEQPTPTDSDTTGADYTFEKYVTKSSGQRGFADVWKRGHFAWEYKRKGRNLLEAYSQLQEYREDLENPPLLIVSDMQIIEIHTNFNNSRSRLYRFSLEDLLDPLNLNTLREVFINPDALRVSPTTLAEKNKRAIGEHLIPYLRDYLREIQAALAKYDVKELIELSTRPGSKPTSKFAPNISLARRRSLEKAQRTIHNNQSQPIYVRQLSTPDLQQPNVSMEQFLVEYEHIVLLGAPGSGKSTTLRRLFNSVANFWSEDEPIPNPNQNRVGIDANITSEAVSSRTSIFGFPEDWKYRIPLFIQLNQWVNPELSLSEFLQAQFRLMDAPQLAEALPNWLQSGKVILLLDGLNEIPNLERKETTGEITDKRFQSILRLGNRTDAKIICVVSCRVGDFSGDTDWHSLHILPLNPNQIGRFVEVYYEENESLKQSLLNGLYEDANPVKQKLREFITRPFYLVKFLDYYQLKKEEGVSDEVAFPDNPAYVLYFSVDSALEYEIDAGRVQQIDKNELQKRLQCLAFNMTDAGVVSITLDQALTWLLKAREHQHPIQPLGEPTIDQHEKQKAFKLLALAEGASLIINTGCEIQFYHQLLQEYFCALYCLGQETVEPTLFHRLDEATEVWRIYYGLDKSLIEKLLPLLDTKHGNSVRYGVARILGELGDKRAIEPLMASLELDQDEQVRCEAALALGKLGDIKAITPLIYSFDETSYTELRFKIEQALVLLGKAALSRLTDSLLEKIDYYLSPKILEALGEIGYKPIVAIAIKLILKGEIHQENVRESAAYALGELGDKRAVNPLIKILISTETSERIVETVARALGKLRDEQAIEPLINSFKSKLRDVPGISSEALVRIGVAALPTLIKALSDTTNSSMRFWAAETLGWIGNAQVIPYLQDIRNNDKGKSSMGKVKDAADKAIRRIEARMS